MRLKRIGPFSCGKIVGVLYAAMGLIVGAIFALFSLVGGIAGMASDAGEGAVFAFFFGAGAVIVLPIFYGVLGFIGGVISAALYNLIAAWLGGIELEFEGPPT
jgi:hypothetical protein